MPEFSIVVPVYNGEKYLAEALESVLQQTFTDWEMVLVDDGSRDRSAQICDEYCEKEPRIRCIHKDNEGVAIARKTGVLSAEGEYIVFLDGDDWLDRDCTEGMDRIIRDHSPDILAFGHMDEMTDGTSRPWRWEYQGAFSRSQIETQIFPYLIHNSKARYFPYNLCGNAIRRELIRDYMIADSRATIGEDGACMIPTVYHSQSIFFLQDCYYHYRYNTESASRSRKVIHWDNAQVIAEHISRCIDLNQRDFREQLDRKIVHDVFLICVSRFHAGKSFRETREEIIQETGRVYYRNAICRAKFSGNPKATLMQLALRQNLVGLIYLYYKR